MAILADWDLLARVREMKALLDAPAPATSAAPAAPPTTVSLADTAAANASSVQMDVEAAPLTGAAAAPQSLVGATSHAADGASDLQIDALRAWLASVPEAVRADAKHAACNTNYVKVTRQNWFKTFDDRFFEDKLRKLGVHIPPGAVVCTRAFEYNLRRDQLPPP